MSVYGYTYLIPFWTQCMKKGLHLQKLSYEGHPAGKFRNMTVVCFSFCLNRSTIDSFFHDAQMQPRGRQGYVQLFKSTSRQLCPTNMYWGIRLSCLQALQAQILLVGRRSLILCVNDSHSSKRWGLLVTAGTSFMNKLQSYLVTQANAHKPNGTKTLQKEWFFWINYTALKHSENKHCKQIVLWLKAWLSTPVNKSSGWSVVCTFWRAMTSPPHFRSKRISTAVWSTVGKFSLALQEIKTMLIVKCVTIVK